MVSNVVVRTHQFPATSNGIVIKDERHRWTSVLVANGILRGKREPRDDMVIYFLSESTKEILKDMRSINAESSNTVFNVCHENCTKVLFTGTMSIGSTQLNTVLVLSLAQKWLLASNETVGKKDTMIHNNSHPHNQVRQKTK